MQFKISKPEETKTIAKVVGVEWTEGMVFNITAPKTGVPRPCECGCKGMTSGGLWMPGHDAKRKSRLYAAIRSGIPAEVEFAKKELTERDWPMPSTKSGAAFEPLTKAAETKSA